jgi:hypothetical protein
MRIPMMADGRVLEGTAKQIAGAMDALAFGWRTARCRSTSTGRWTRPGA